MLSMKYVESNQCVLLMFYLVLYLWFYKPLSTISTYFSGTYQHRNSWRHFFQTLPIRKHRPWLTYHTMCFSERLAVPVWDRLTDWCIVNTSYYHGKGVENCMPPWQDSYIFVCVLHLRQVINCTKLKPRWNARHLCNKNEYNN